MLHRIIQCEARTLHFTSSQLWFESGSARCVKLIILLTGLVHSAHWNHTLSHHRTACRLLQGSKLHEQWQESANVCNSAGRNVFVYTLHCRPFNLREQDSLKLVFKESCRNTYKKVVTFHLQVFPGCATELKWRSLNLCKARKSRLESNLILSPHETRLGAGLN